MFSKTKFIIVAALISSIGCTDFLHGKKKSQEPLEVESQEVECLKVVPQFINDYFNDKSKTEDIDTNFACLQKSLDIFVKFTRSSTPDQYTDKDLQYFLNRFLLSENPISDEFLEQIMNLKTFAVGGSHHSFSRLEITQFKTYIDVIRVQLQNLNGSLRLILFRSSIVEATEDRLEAAQKKVSEVFANLIFESQIQTADFEFSNIETLLGQFGGLFLHGENPLSEILKWFPLMDSIRSAFLGDDLKPATHKQWQSTIDWSAGVYFKALAYYYNVRHYKFVEPADWEKTIALSDGLFSLLESSPQMVSKGFLSLGKVDSVIDEIWKLKLFESKVSSVVIETTYKKALCRIIDSNSTAPCRPPDVQSLDLKELATVKLEYQIWRHTQNFIDSLYADQPIGSEALTASILQDALRSSMTVGPNPTALEVGWGEWARLLAQPKRPVVIGASQKISLAPQIALQSYSFHGLSLMNVFRSAARLVMRGYSGSSDPGLFNGTVGKKEISVLETDFRELGLSVKFFDPRETNTLQKRFEEANLFTFSGNGDDRLDGRELFEFINFIFSGGYTAATEIDGWLEKNHGHLQRLDVMGYPLCDENAFKQVLKDHFAEIFSNMPMLARFMKTLPVAEWDEVYRSIMLVAKTQAKADPGVIEYGDIKSFATILHYVESLMIQFDLDGSQGLSVSELLKAEPRFHNLIKAASPLKSDLLIPEIFLYIIFEGQKPTLSTQLIGYSVDRTFGLGEASRLQLFRVLAILKGDAN